MDLQLTEYKLNGATFIDIKDLLPLRPYATGCTSIPKLIARKQLNNIINGRISNGALVQTETRSFKYGSVFVNKDDITDLFTNTDSVDPPAPPVITDDDLIFFKDSEGNQYDVLMRGERTKDGIFFKVKDVELVFKMTRLDDIIQKPDTRYQIHNHYEWFLLQGDANNLRNHTSRELYLTYTGLMHVIDGSRSGIGKDFKSWIDQVVFATLWGTQDQKIETLHKALNVDADHLSAIMKKSGDMISCLYLIDIGVDNGMRLYKYGFTKDINRRFKEHMKRYGDNINMKQFRFIPELSLSKAESEFRNSVSRYKYNRKGDDELIRLCDEGYLNIQTILSTISAKYCGNMRDQLSIYEKQMTDMTHHHEIEIMKKDATIARMEAIIALKDKDIEILQLRLAIATK